ncbi:MAG: hypothetical protein AB1762_05330, partial [Gemmatimonadota bacterium]
ARQMSSIVRGTLVAAYALAFAYVVLFVDESYGTIVRFYGPTLVLFLIAAALQALRSGVQGWGLVAVSFVLSIVAAIAQQTRIALHPVYFDHNAVYHVIQGIALVLLYFGFTRVSRRSPAPGAQ